MRPGSQGSVALIATLLAFACGGGPPPSNGPSAPEAEVATALVVDQFLRAANSNDLDTMSRLFGTRNGSILKRDPKEQVDRQMFALASLLRHESYEIVRHEVVPGRREEATTLIVRMKMADNNVADVPYTLVFSTDRTWLIELIDLKALSRR
jgi:hypothetical protein